MFFLNRKKYYYYVYTMSNFISLHLCNFCLIQRKPKEPYNHCQFNSICRWSYPMLLFWAGPWKHKKKLNRTYNCLESPIFTKHSRYLYWVAENYADLCLVTIAKKWKKIIINFQIDNWIHNRVVLTVTQNRCATAAIV